MTPRPMASRAAVRVRPVHVGGTGEPRTHVLVVPDGDRVTDQQHLGGF